MPIYEYECVEQKHRFEAMQKIGDRPLKECQVCGGKVKKIISATAFSLKGGGWYKDGYASTVSPSEKSTTSTTSSAKDASSKSAAKPEVKK